MLNQNRLLSFFIITFLFSSITTLVQVREFVYHGNSTIFTTVTLYCFVWSLAGLFVIISASKTKQIQWLLACTSTLLTLFVFEVYLYSSGYYITYSEKNFGVYSSPYQPSSWSKNIRDKINVEQEQYENYTPADTESYGKERLNKLGYRGPLPDTGSNTLIIVGDSFVEGYGARQSSTMPRFIARYLKDRQCTIPVFNAGLAGSDPIFDFYRLKTLSKAVSPNAILFVINSSDINDVSIRGGEQRFLPDTVQYKDGPNFEFIYAASFISRVVINHFWSLNHILRTKQKHNKEQEKAVHIMANFFKERVAPYYADQDTSYYVMMVPGSYDIKKNKITNPHYKLLRKKLRANRPQRFYDSAKYLIKNYNNIKQLYWPIDKHPKPEGYRALGQAAGRFLLSYDNIRKKICP